MSMDSLPVAFGVLTVDSIRQIQRSGTKPVTKAPESCLVPPWKWSACCLVEVKVISDESGQF